MADIIISLFKALWAMVEGITEALMQRLGASAHYLMSRKKTPHQAQWGKARELLRRRHAGFLVQAPKKSISLSRSYQHMLVAGASGAGKSSRIVIPGILRALEQDGASVFVHDPSGELFARTSGAAQAKGYTVRRIFYGNAFYSSGFNPLARCHGRAQAAQVANLLLESGLSGPVSGDSFWNASAESVLTVLILILLTQPPQYRNLANLRFLLDQVAGAPGKVDALVAKHADNQLFAEYKAVIAGQPDKLLGNVLATARAALKILQDDQLALVTSYNSVDFSMMRKEKMILYVQSDVLRQSYYAPITSILFMQMLQELMQEIPGKESRPILAFIDEAATLKISWETVLSQARKYNIGIQLQVQSENQLSRNFTKDGAIAIRQNSGVQVYFGNQELETALRLERLLGKTRFEGRDGKSTVASLLSAQEIRDIGTDRALVVAFGIRPFIIRLRPYYKTRLKKLAAMPALNTVGTLPWSTPPLLPL